MAKPFQARILVEDTPSTTLVCISGTRDMAEVPCRPPESCWNHREGRKARGGRRPEFIPDAKGAAKRSPDP